MIVQFSPVCSNEEKIDYKFNGEKVQFDDKIIDLSTVEEGKQYDVIYPVTDVTRENDGVLKVTLIQYHAPDAGEDERYPKPFKSTDNELDNLETFVLEEIETAPNEPEKPSEVELLKTQLEALKKEKDMLEIGLMEMAMEVYK